MGKGRFGKRISNFFEKEEHTLRKGKNRSLPFLWGGLEGKKAWSGGKRGGKKKKRRIMSMQTGGNTKALLVEGGGKGTGGLVCLRPSSHSFPFT